MHAHGVHRFTRRYNVKIYGMLYNEPSIEDQLKSLLKLQTQIRLWVSYRHDKADRQNIRTPVVTDVLV